MQVSISIPCYNSGAYLREALASIKNAGKNVSYEVIIIDDGSDDVPTVELFKILAAEHYTIIHQENKGPGAARNAGIQIAKGRYIQFLDADNLLRPGCLKTAVDILDAQSDIGVVYGKAAFFGADDHPRFVPQPFDMARLLAGNYIDMCAMVRSEAWDQVGGLDETRLLMGHADWDFWIRIAAKRWRFYFLDEILFDYRILHDSLISTTYNPDSFLTTKEHIYSKFIGKRIYQFLNRLYSPLPYYLVLFRMNKRSFFTRMIDKIRRKVKK